MARKRRGPGAADVVAGGAAIGVAGGAGFLAARPQAARQVASVAAKAPGFAWRAAMPALGAVAGYQAAQSLARGEGDALRTAADVSTLGWGVASVTGAAASAGGAAAKLIGSAGGVAKAAKIAATAARIASPLGWASLALELGPAVIQGVQAASEEAELNGPSAGSGGRRRRRKGSTADRIADAGDAHAATPQGEIGRAYLGAEAQAMYPSGG